jgi:hypothetical protein
MTSESEFILPASTVCHCDGLPFELAGDTVIRMHPKSWALIHWRTVNNGRPFRSLEESQAFGRIVEEGKKT